MRDYARQHKMIVAMANFSRESGRWQGIRKSAIWNAHGDLLAVAPEKDDFIVIGARENNVWKTN